MQNPKWYLWGTMSPFWPSNLNTLMETKIPKSVTHKQDNKHLCHFHTQGGRRGVTPYNALHTIDGIVWKGCLFQALGIWKGRDFTSWSIKRAGNLSFRFVRDLKGLTGAFYGFKKDKKTSWFSDLFIFKRRCIYSSEKGCKVLKQVT